MTKCLVVGCGRAIIARNLCTKHYQYHSYHKTLDQFNPGRTGRTDSSHPMYVVWGSMKTRCDNPSSKSYGNYGAKGITYDPRWADFNNFLTDMQEGYIKGLWLDRIDNNKGYFKENCRWVNPQDSNRNRTFCKVTEEIAAEVRHLYEEGLKSQTEIGAKFGIDQTTVSDIIRRKSWKTETDLLADLILNPDEMLEEI